MASSGRTACSETTCCLARSTEWCRFGSTGKGEKTGVLELGQKGPSSGFGAKAGRNRSRAPRESASALKTGTCTCKARGSCASLNRRSKWKFRLRAAAARGQRSAFCLLPVHGRQRHRLLVYRSYKLRSVSRYPVISSTLQSLTFVYNVRA